LFISYCYANFKLSCPPDAYNYTYTSVLEIREAKIEGNIQTVPEPLTVFGSVMAFGFGVLFCKRKANDQREFTHQ
jgi:hypothetical protein